MNIPNFLTLVRMLLVPILVIFLIQGAFLKALIVFIVAGITDALDGLWAKVLKQETVLGSYLDPLADKALVVSSFVTLSVLGMIPAWLTVIVVSRDFVILMGFSVLFFMSISFEIRPAFVSKVTTALQLFTIILVLTLKCLSRDPNYQLVEMVYWVTAAFTVFSGLNYVLRGVKIISSAE